MIHIILVNYNGTADTIACIRSLQMLDEPAVTITVIDNASDAKNATMLNDWGLNQGLMLSVSPDAHPAINGNALKGMLAIRGVDMPFNLIFSSENLGFAGGNNIGISIAMADPFCTYLWILNNDTEVEPDALSALRRRMAEDQLIGICGSTLVYHDNRALVQALGGRFNKWLVRPEQLAALSSRDNLPLREDIEKELAYIIGASMLVTRAFVVSVGPMSDDYFLYYEEIDWAIRGQPDFKLAWAPDSIVYHKEGRSIGTSTRTRPSNSSLYYMTRSMLRFIGRHRPLMLPGGVARLSLKASMYLFKGDWQAARAIGKASIHAAGGLKGALKRPLK
jgi:GT2 family glycosyltransferase